MKTIDYNEFAPFVKIKNNLLINNNLGFVIKANPKIYKNTEEIKSYLSKCGPGDDSYTDVTTGGKDHTDVYCDNGYTDGSVDLSRYSLDELKQLIAKSMRAVNFPDAEVQILCEGNNIDFIFNLNTLIESKLLNKKLEKIREVVIKTMKSHKGFIVKND